MKRLSLISLFIPFMLICFFNNTPAQDIDQSKANFELASKFSRENLRKMVYDLSVEPNWLEESEKFWYKYKTTAGTHYYIVDPETGAKSLLFDNDHIASEMTVFTNKPYNSKDLQIKELKFFDNNNRISFKVDSLLFQYDINGRILEYKGVIPRKELPRWVTYSPDSSVIVFAKDHDLYIMYTDDPDSTEYRLTTDGEKDYSYRSSSRDTSKSERKKANLTWFRDSSKFYSIRRDQRKVNDLYLINSLSKPRPTLETYKYTMPGEKNAPQYEMYIFDKDKRTNIKVGVEKWQDQELGGTYAGPGYFFGKSNDKLYFVRRDRMWRKLDLCRVNAETGELKVMVSEDSKPYFNFMNMRFAELNDGDEFIWWAERDNWGHLYLYDGNGELKNRITQGPFLAYSIANIDTAGRTLYFNGYGREKDIYPYHSKLYRINLDGSEIDLLTPEEGDHDVDFSESGKYFVDNYSQINSVPRSVLKDNSGKVILDLESADISRLEEAGWRMPERFTVKAGDGITNIYGVMWKPFDFDPEKKYPIVANVYPGPQTEPFPTDFSPTSRNITLSQLGFIVIAPGNRGGSPYRSKWYHNYGYGNLRDYGLEDIKTTIEQLSAKYSFIDINRTGIYGHSGGGFMSTAAMLVYPDFFKAAVSSSGNHDNNVYSKWWSEMHHGVEEIVMEVKDEETGEIRKEYEYKSEIPANHELAENLKGHLLITTSDMDNNVHPANTLRMVDALIKANKRFDFMIFPGKRHGYGDYNSYFERMLLHHFAKSLLKANKDNVDIYELIKKK
ncbi:MAG: S9 family peptidase [bacterium]|nr:S9 family peptidase [bacterium]